MEEHGDDGKVVQEGVEVRENEEVKIKEHEEMTRTVLSSDKGVGTVCWHNNECTELNDVLFTGETTYAASYSTGIL